MLSSRALVDRVQDTMEDCAEIDAWELRRKLEVLTCFQQMELST